MNKDSFNWLAKQLLKNSVAGYNTDKTEQELTKRLFMLAEAYALAKVLEYVADPDSFNSEIKTAGSK